MPTLSPNPLSPSRSFLKSQRDKVLGTAEEWVSLGAPRDRPFDIAYLSPIDCRLWHDACMACMTAGYMPPWRPKALRTLKAPEWKDAPCTVRFIGIGAWPHGPCPLCPCFAPVVPWPPQPPTNLPHDTILPPHKDCKFRGCKGNTTFWRDKEKKVLAFRWALCFPITCNPPTCLLKLFPCQRFAHTTTGCGITSPSGPGGWTSKATSLQTWWTMRCAPTWRHSAPDWLPTGACRLVPAPMCPCA